MNDDIVARIMHFIEHEMRSCSMDIGGITPLYVYRMWGGEVSLEEIEEGFNRLPNLLTGRKAPAGEGWGLGRQVKCVGLCSRSNRDIPGS